MMMTTTAAEFDAARELHAGDPLRAVASLILAWCDGKDDHDVIVKLPQFMFFAFTVRVWHLERIIGALFGPVPPFGRT